MSADQRSSDRRPLGGSLTAMFVKSLHGRASDGAGRGGTARLPPLSSPFNRVIQMNLLCYILQGAGPRKRKTYTHLSTSMSIHSRVFNSNIQ